MTSAPIEPGKRKHAALAASASKRWLKCPGSVALNLTLEPLPDSPYAKEGTRAHALCQHVLENDNWDVSQYIGSSVPDFSEDETRVDKQMADAVQVYADTVKALLEPGARLFVEQRFELPELGIDPGTGKPPHGTNDACVYNPRTRQLTVIDYKHGAGMYVETDDNTQLLFYAAGAVRFLRMAKAAVSDVTICIVQPRIRGAEPVRQVRVPVSDVRDWLVEMAEGADRCRQPNAPLVPGPHCKGTWCTAAYRDACPAFRGEALRAAQNDFGELVDPTRASPKELGERLRGVKLLKDYISCLESHADAEARAGRMPEGFKWVRGNGRRMWAKSDDEVIRSLVGRTNASSFKHTRIFTVPEAEEVFGRATWKALTGPKGELEGLTEMRQGKPTLAPVEDRRAAITLSATEDLADEGLASFLEQMNSD